MNNITLDTFPDREGAEEQRLFTVPMNWLTDIVLHTFFLTLDDFFREYTWEDTWQIYELAREDGVLVSERIIVRA